MEIGFELDLPQPPLVTISGKNTTAIQKVRNAILKFNKEHAQQSKEFAETSALLGRLMARRKNSFRKMILYRNIQKINSASLRLLTIDLPRDAENFFGALPDNFEVIDSQVEVPTRSNLEYFMIRLYSVFGIYERIRELCLNGAELITKMLYKNYFMEINTLFLAVLAKMNDLSTKLGNKCVELFNILGKCKEDFPLQKKTSCLSKHLGSLPETLKKFEVKKIESKFLEGKEKLPNLVLLEDIPKTKVPILNKMQQKVDLGEKIERKDLKSLTTVEKKFDLSKLKTLEDVKSFIVKENGSRTAALNSCFTKNIANHEWSGAQKIFQRKAQENKKQAVNFFINFLKSKI